jgi:hypothetical protein
MRLISWTLWSERTITILWDKENQAPCKTFHRGFLHTELGFIKPFYESHKYMYNAIFVTKRVVHCTNCHYDLCYRKYI